MISQVFSHCEEIQNILDDIVVHERNEGDHKLRLRAVLQRIKDKGWTLNCSKCEFGMNEITLIGHVLPENVIGPTQDRITSLLVVKESTNAAELISVWAL